ncbi:MAG: TraR/DksA C4-type zinc finger protein [Verrucomicrobiota bacterium]
MSDPTNESNPMPQAGASNATEQVLGKAAHPEASLRQIEPRWRPFYEQLLQRRDELIDATAGLRGDAREIVHNPLKNEPAEIGSESFERDSLLGEAAADQEILGEVYAAISRIENGTYGICELTGRPIPEERLEAIPWTRFTVEAEQQREEHGQSTKAAVGPRGGLHKRSTAPPGRLRDQEGSR